MECIICGKEIEKSKYMNTIVCSDSCFTTNFWLERVKNKNDKNQVVIGREVYQIEDEDSKSPFRGYNGMKFKIKFPKGRRVTTTNLWSNGTIPLAFKELLPDNAKFESNKGE